MCLDRVKDVHRKRRETEMESGHTSSQVSVTIKQGEREGRTRKEDSYEVGSTEDERDTDPKKQGQDT